LEKGRLLKFTKASKTLCGGYKGFFRLPFLGVLFSSRIAGKIYRGAGGKGGKIREAS